MTARSHVSSFPHSLRPSSLFLSPVPNRDTERRSDGCMLSAAATSPPRGDSRVDTLHSLIRGASPLPFARDPAVSRVASGAVAARIPYGHTPHNLAAHNRGVRAAHGFEAEE